MKFQFIYFSGTGNTWWVTHQLIEKLNEMGHNTHWASIENPILQDFSHLQDLINNADILALGSPIYGSDIPEMMMNFIKNLPIPKKKPLKVFTYCTQLIASGDGAYFYHKILENKGYDLWWAVHYDMPSNLFVRSTGKAATGKKLERKIARASKKIEKTIQKINMDIKWLQGKYFGQMGILQRFFFQKEFSRYRKSLRIDSERCNKCKLCISLCPVSNISLSSNQIEFAENCNLCMRCVNHCPQKAIFYLKTPFSISNSVMYLGPSLNFDPKKMKEDFK